MESWMISSEDEKDMDMESLILDITTIKRYTTDK